MILLHNSNQSFCKKSKNQHTRKFSLNNQKQDAKNQKSTDYEFDTLTDWVDEQENTKQTLKCGLLSFLDYVEKVENEKLHRKG